MQSFLRPLAYRSPIRRTPTLRTFSMSSTSYSNANSDSATAEEPSSFTIPKVPLALPEAPHDGTTTLDMSNGDASVKLDHLGPMVVNVDGTMSRISNWDAMADIEKENTLRIIGKRNQVRLKALREKEGIKKDGK